MIVSPYYRKGVTVSSERYEQPDPISLLNERTHGDGGAVNQSDGKPEPLIRYNYPFPPSTSLSLSLFLIHPFAHSQIFYASLMLFIRYSFSFCLICDCVRKWQYINRDKLR